MHGAAHGLLWYYEDSISLLPPRDTIASSDMITKQGLVVIFTVSFAFWYSFLGMAIPAFTSRTTMLLQCILHSTMLVFVVPRLLLFGYTNTVLFINYGLQGLYNGFGGRKDWLYAVFSLASVPIIATTWAEPLLCDLLLIGWGGHIIFDFTIPLANLAALGYAVSMIEPRSATDDERNVKAL